MMKGPTHLPANKGYPMAFLLPEEQAIDTCGGGHQSLELLLAE